MVDKDYTAGGIYYYLPDALKSVITDKLIYTQTRYHESNVLSTDNEKLWTNVGKLWLPAEFEVMGAKIMTTTGWTAGNEIQYPLFAHNMNRVKRVQGGNSRCAWWLASAYCGDAAGFVCVSYAGCTGSGQRIRRASRPHLLPNFRLIRNNPAAPCGRREYRRKTNE